jgi:hypothetical protein
MGSSDQPWVRISVGLWENPKVLSVPVSARWLYVACICYCGKHLTDGYFSDKAATRLCQEAGTRRASFWRLVEVQLVVAAPDAVDLWHLPDYLEWNTPRAEVMEKREANALRMREARQRRAQRAGSNGPGVHSNVHAHATDVRANVRSIEVEVETELLTHPPSTYEEPAERADDTVVIRPQAVDGLVPTALAILADRDLEAALARGRTIANVDGYRASCLAARHRDHASQMHALVKAQPLIDASGLADEVLRVGALAAPSGVRPPSPPPGPDTTARAARAIFERNAARAAGLACPQCDDTGVYLDDDGFAHECPCRHGVNVEALRSDVSRVVSLDGPAPPPGGFDVLRKEAGRPLRVVMDDTYAEEDLWPTNPAT